MNQILTSSGEKITLEQWQDNMDIPPLNVAHYIRTHEIKQPFLLAEPLLQLFDLVREKWGKPLIINSAFRTREKQLQLIADGYRAAKNSPHEQGMAFDIDTKTYDESKKLASLIQEIARENGFAVRVGYKEYWETKKQTFVHMDICPMYFAKGKVFNHVKHPPQWENTLVW